MSLYPSSTLITHFKDYEQFHHTRGNKVTHFVGIPLVMFSLLGLLGHVPIFGHVDLGIALVALGAGFAFRVDYKLAIPFSLAVLLNYLVARHLDLRPLVILQIVGWVFQLLGHYRYEKKSPAFFKTVSHLFVGPMWIFAWIIGYYQPTPSVPA